MAQYAPTLLECRDWVMEHCTNLLKTTVNDHKDYLVAIDSTRIFVNALDAPHTVTLPLLQNLDALTQSFETETDTDVVVQKIKSICEACTPWLDPVSYIRCDPTTPGLVASKYHLEDAKVIPPLTPSHYNSMWPNHLNEETAWFRQYFFGNPYITLIGPLSHDNHPSTALGLTASMEYDTTDPADDDLSYAIISVVQENSKSGAASSRRKFGDNSDTIQQHETTDLDDDDLKATKATGLISTGLRYRLIIRNKRKVIRCVLSDETVTKTLTRLEALGQVDRLVTCSAHQQQQKQKQKRRPLRSFSSAIIHHTTSLSSSSLSSLQRHQRHQQQYNNDQGDDDLHDGENDDDDDDDDTADNDDTNDDITTTSNLHYHHSQRHRQPIHRNGHTLYHFLHAAVLSVYNHLDLQQFKTLTAESTILAGLEKGLLRFDEMEVPKNYKFGLLSVQDDQASEEKWFSNTGLSDDLEQFLNIIGQRITLQGYKGYAAGLDTKCGESGEYSYVTTWKENEIMFHVGPLMPYNAQDKQQVHRKRYIGNDIVCIVFVETNKPHLFDPGSIRSQFLHVFIVVHPEMVDGKRCWRVEVVSNKSVQEFGPPTPSPPLFFGENELREFLILKLVSAENAALQSDKFSIPNSKARQGIFKTLVDTGLAAPSTLATPISASKPKYSTTLLSSNSLLRSSKNGLTMMGGGGSLSAQQQSINGNNSSKANKTSNHFYTFSNNNNDTTSDSDNTPQRPKSAGPTGRNYSRASMRSLRAALESPNFKVSSTNSSSSLVCSSVPPSSSSSSSLVTAVTRSLTPDPTSSSSSNLFPYASRSNMLRDLKNLATRRRHSTASSSGGGGGSSNSRAPTPSSIDGRPPPRTDSPIYSLSSYHSPARDRSVESPISWIDEAPPTIVMDKPSTSMDSGHGSSSSHCLPPPPPPAASKSDLSSRSYSSSSLNAATTTTTAALLTQPPSTYYSPPSPPPTTLDMMKWTVNKTESNHSIRSRAQHLMSTMMMGRRKQQQQQQQQQHAINTTLLSTSPSSSLPSCLTSDDNNTINSPSPSMISRMSRTKSSYLKE